MIHTHSPYATVLAVAGIGIPPVVEDQVVFLGGEVKVARYAPSGTHELAANAIEALGERNAVLLAGHGAIGVGRSLREAMAVCELLEKTAMVYVCTMALGRASPLPNAAVAAARGISPGSSRRPTSRWAYLCTLASGTTTPSGHTGRSAGDEGAPP